MFDLSWSEFAVIALAALVVIGPKELPTVLRTVGKVIGKTRNAVRAFLKDLDISDSSPSHFVYDDKGNRFPAYDLSDFLPPQKPKEHTEKQDKAEDSE